LAALEEDFEDNVLEDGIKSCENHWPEGAMNKQVFSHDTGVETPSTSKYVLSSLAAANAF
jgi:hypothetical protein